MEIEIKNFGPISYLKFDLDKDLHLIYGKNAVGKSYATYCIYCLLKNLSNRERFRHKNTANIINYERLINEKLVAEIQGVDITDFYKLEVEKSMAFTIGNNIENSFHNTFSSLSNLHNQYSKLEYEIIISSNANERIIICADTQERMEIKYFWDEEIDVTIHQTEEKDKKKYSIYLQDRGVSSNYDVKSLAIELDSFVNDKVLEILMRFDSSFRDIYYLPASRSGLYQALNSFTPIIAELTQSRFFLKNKSIELPSLSEPLSDYFIDLSTLNKNRNNNKFDEIINFLENDILNGKVDYNEDTKRIMYQPNDTTLELDLSEASSMVSELSPLVIYFKHIINNKYYSNSKNSVFKYFLPVNMSSGYKDIIFIEEPEAHLHPEIQVKLMELFVKLTKLNLKIFITSHSNYMFNKLNNLIISGEMDYKNVMVYHLVHTDKGSVNDHEMTPTKDGMNDENFQDVSEQLYYERMKFLEENDLENE